MASSFSSSSDPMAQEDAPPTSTAASSNNPSALNQFGYAIDNIIGKATQSRELQAGHTTAGTKNTRMATAQSPARSKRGSPSDGSEDDGNGVFLPGSRHRKKKGGNRPPPQSSTSPSLVAPVGPSTSTAPCPLGVATSSQATVSGQNGSAHASQLATSTRYALSRFPFPPIIIRFNTLSAKSSVKKIQDELVAHGNSVHKAIITFLHGRASNVRCDLNEVDILLYVKDVTSFALLIDLANWPPVLCGEVFSFPSAPSCPPQLSIIIRNVDRSVDLVEMTDELKSAYPSTRIVTRLKNKFGNETDLLKVDLASPVERQSIIDAKKISLNHMRYFVGEYLAPASVLICSKCCGIGHFRKQCEDQHDTCKKCGQSCADIKAHQCSTPLSCKHCSGDHLANSLKCPVIRSFRAELTRKLLNKNESHNIPTTPSSWSGRAGTQAPLGTAPSIAPAVPFSWPPINTADASMSSKLDSLINGLASLQVTMSKVCDSNARLEGLVADQSSRVLRLEAVVSNLVIKSDVLETELTQCKSGCASHQTGAVLTASLAKQVILPMIEDLLLAMCRLNKDAAGKTLDADLQCRFERYRVQVSKAVEGKALSQ
jgi:hypothetical protein